MRHKNANDNTAVEDESFQQIETSPDPCYIYDTQQEETPQMDSELLSARTQEHMRRLAVGGLCDTDPRRSEKTEYVMRLLVNGRAPLGEPPVPAVPEPLPGQLAISELLPEPERRAEPKQPRGMTLENLTFDDLLAELENITPEL